MTQQNVALNPRQASFLLVACIVAYKIINLPAMLCAGGGRDLWLGALVLMAWEVVLTVCFVLVNKAARGRTLATLLQSTFGNAGKSILLFAFAAYFMLKVYLAVLTTEQFLTTNLFDNIGWIPFGVPLVLIALYGAIKGIRATGRTAELVGVPIVIGMAISLGVELFSTDLQMLLPVGTEALGSLKAAESALMGTGDAVVLFAFVGRVEQKKLGVRLSVASILSTLFVVLFCVCFYGFYGQAGMYMRHGLAISDMLQYINGADTLLRLDIFAASVAIMLSVFKIAAFACAANSCIREALGKEDTERNRMNVALGMSVVLVSAVLLLQSFIVDVYTALEGWIKYLAIVPFQVGIPVLSAVALAVSRKKRGKGNGDSACSLPLPGTALSQKRSGYD